MLEQIKNQDTTIIKFEGIEITVFLTRKEYSGTVIELNEDTLKDFVDELKRRPVILGETLSHIFDYSEIKAKLANILNSNPKSAEDIPKEWRKLWNDLYDVYLQDEGLDERYRNAMEKMTFGSTTIANILEQSLLLSSLFNIFVNKIPFRKYPEKKITERTLASIRELVPFLVIGVNGSVFAPESINRIKIDEKADEVIFYQDLQEETNKIKKRIQLIDHLIGILKELVKKHRTIYLLVPNNYGFYLGYQYRCPFATSDDGNEIIEMIGELLVMIIALKFGIPYSLPDKFRQIEKY